VQRAASLLTVGLLLSPAAAAGRPQALVQPVQYRSVEVLEPDEPLFSRPAGGSPRRGAAEKGARLPLYKAARGGGCGGRWLLVGTGAWICEDRVRLSTRPAPRPTPAPGAASGPALPHAYYLVGPDGSFGYERLADAEDVAPAAQLEPDFIVAVVRVAAKYPGADYALTTHGLWLPMRDLSPVAAPSFHGVALEGSLDVGWVHADHAAEYQRPGGARTAARRPRLSSFRVAERQRVGGRRWYRTDDGAWLRGDHVRVPTLAAPPEGVGAGERWIDVELEQQTLTAYEGARPVYATLVSTGRGPQSSDSATPKGEFRVWVKLLTSDMNNLEAEAPGRYYAIDDVPWVMFFHKGYGLHGAFWHDDFGNVRSHGCVNLAPRDARWLFEWTAPSLPTGFRALLPSPGEPATLIRVR